MRAKSCNNENQDRDTLHRDAVATPALTCTIFAGARSDSTKLNRPSSEHHDARLVQFNALQCIEPPTVLLTPVAEASAIEESRGYRLCQ